MSRTIADYANELNEFYCKIQDLQKAIPSEFGYKLNSVLSSYSEMFSRFCPFKVGDRVRLTKTPAIERGSGWYGSRHFLVEGAIATVKGCDWKKGKFVFDLEFDNESWVDSEGRIQSIAPERRHVFGFGEDWVVSTDDWIAGEHTS